VSAPDRSWTIAPTLLWFGGFLAVGLWVQDGGIHALADRLTSRRSTDAQAPAGPMPAKPVVVADTKDVPEDKPAPPPDAPKGDHSKIGVLEDVCLDGTPSACKRWGMDGFYRAVAEAKKGKLQRPVRVSWFGDSVIATDAIPGRLRTKLQGELGDGGPGFIFVVAPHRFCAHEAVTRSWNGDWNAYGISTVPIRDGMYGVGGSTAEADGGHAVIRVINGTATKVELYYLAQPKGGHAKITADGSEVISVDTKGDKAPGFVAGTSPGAKKFDISTEGRVRLFGIDLENASGAVVDNLGIVSVNVRSFGTVDTAHWTNELAHRNADLVMIMIGANEAQWLGPYDRDTKEYAERYGKVVATFRAARPDGACLVVSPTDQAEAKDGEYPSRPVMPVLVAAQRKAAQSAGCAFFSTYEWMGGKGSAAKWFARGLVGSDFQHLSTKGANKFADAVFETLMAGYKRYAAP
jgi:lysophospholipase L1-like esterase